MTAPRNWIAVLTQSWPFPLQNIFSQKLFFRYWEVRKKRCRNHCCRYADSRLNALAFRAGVPTLWRMGIPTSQRFAFCCLWRAIFTSRCLAVSRKRRRRCASVLRCCVRCPTATAALSPPLSLPWNVIGSVLEDSCPLVGGKVNAPSKGTKQKSMAGTVLLPHKTSPVQSISKTTTVQTKDSCKHQGNKY